ASAASVSSPAGQPPACRPPGFPLGLQAAGAPRRVGGQLNPNLRGHRHLEEGRTGENIRAGDELTEGEESLLVGKKRQSDSILLGEWSQDGLEVKRVRNGEPEEGGKKNEAGRKRRRREREELKEQLEEARERLQALQEKVWKVFGEKHRLEEERGRHGNKDVGTEDEEDVFDEDDGGDLEKESFSLLSGSPFETFHKHREDKQKDKEGRTERGGGGRPHLDGVTDGGGLSLEADEWNGMEDDGEEGGQKFAQALKVELGSAVARVIDRVLRLYGEMMDAAPSSPSSPPSALAFLPSEAGNNGGRESGLWMGLLMGGRGEDKRRGKGEKAEEDGEKQLQKLVGHIQPHRTQALDLAIPLAVQKSPDMPKAHPLLGPPFPTPPGLPLHHPSLPRPPPLSHPSLLPPSAQSKDAPSSSFHQSSSSSSSYPVPPQLPAPHPPPLPLPLLHYSMQQLFSRSLHHPQLPHLAPSRKDYLSSEPFFDFSSHPSPHPTFPPLPLLGPLDPSLARHSGRERERGMRGEGGMRGGIEGGELFLTAGGISFSVFNQIKCLKRAIPFNKSVKYDDVHTEKIEK
ncbi:unnamed protein product, partial [Tetraodon nigroviridis]